MDRYSLNSTYIPLLITAKSCLEKRDFYLANKKILSAIQACFDRPEAYNLLGIYYELQGKRKKAIKYFRISYFYDQSFVPASINLQRIVENTNKEIDFGI